MAHNPRSIAGAGSLRSGLLGGQPAGSRSRATRSTVALAVARVVLGLPNPVLIAYIANLPERKSFTAESIRQIISNLAIFAYAVSKCAVAASRDPARPTSWGAWDLLELFSLLGTGSAAILLINPISTGLYIVPFAQLVVIIGALLYIMRSTIAAVMAAQGEAYTGWLLAQVSRFASVAVFALLLAVVEGSALQELPLRTAHGRAHGGDPTAGDADRGARRG